MNTESIIQLEPPDAIRLAAVEHWNRGDCELHDRIKAEFQEAQLAAIRRFCEAVEQMALKQDRSGIPSFRLADSYWRIKDQLTSEAKAKE